MIKGKRFFKIVIALLLIVNLGCARKIHVDSIDKPGEIYAGLIDVYIDGKFIPLSAFNLKFSLRFLDSNPSCFNFIFENDKEENFLLSMKKQFFFLVVKGETKKNNKSLCWGTITIKQILYIVPLTKEEAFCLSQLELPDKEIEKLRDNPFKILELCGIKKKPIKVKIKRK